jgi:predicted glutamine amidotransferase
VCRWLAYSGSPVLLDELLYKTEHSLIVQSLHSRLGAEETNGDGFGVGWYGEYDTPALFKSVEPAWGDENLRELAQHTRAELVFAHIRASSGTAVQRSNCHPFRDGRWLWMHNGLIHEFHALRRDLMLEIDPALFADIRGTTDSEVFFFLARTFGLEDEPVEAVARAVGLIEEIGRRHGVEYPMQGTVATTNGQKIWAFRYSSERKSRSLFYSTDVVKLRELHPELEMLRGLSDESRLIVSEPLGSLSGAWNEVPESTCVVVEPGEDELLPFEPIPVEAGTLR